MNIDEELRLYQTTADWAYHFLLCIDQKLDYAIESEKDGMNQINDVIPIQ